jgi:hypothetical protein
MPQISGIHLPKNIQNLIINGDMAIAQRGASFTTGSSTYNLDRWATSKSSAAVHTVTQDTDVPTFAQSGYNFQNSLRYNLITPDTSIASTEYVLTYQVLEGYNFAKIAQKAFTLSFWVKATTTGTYCVSFRNSTGDRSYVAEYTINTTDTWEKKTITVAASPSAGTWNYTTGVGLNISWTLAGGASYQTTAGIWQNPGASTFLCTANQVNGVNTASANFRITGVMLNEGLNAASFQLAGETSAEELLLCQRYYEKSYPPTVVPGTVWTGGSSTGVANSTGRAVTGTRFRILKRANPTMTIYNPGILNTINQFQNPGVNSVVIVPPTGDVSGIDFIDGAATLTTGQAYLFHWTADAEL